MSNRKLVLYISMSVDGFIATEDDDLSWLSDMQNTGDDYGYSDMCASADTYIVGRKTYDVVLDLVGHFPPAKQFKCYVITRCERKDDHGVEFYNGDVEKLIRKLKSEKGKHIYCDGGGEIVRLLMEKNLIDEYIISVIPTMLGSGKRLFIGGVPPISLKATEPKYYSSGLVQLRYVREEPL